MVTYLAMSLVRRVLPLFTPMRTIKTTTAVANMNKHSPNNFLSRTLLDRYMRLHQEDCKIFATYIWIDENGEQLRSKCRVLDFLPKKLAEFPVWTFNTRCAQQEYGSCCEMYLNPVAFYADPFHVGKHRLVLCETYDSQKNPTEKNYRVDAAEAFHCVQDEGIQFGFEQQFVLTDMDKRPWGWPRNGFMGPEGPYFAAIGADKVFGRCIIEAHTYACIYAGLHYGGNNAEVMPSQWEFQTFPTDPIKAADDLWMCRYILERVAEEYGVSISYHPKMFESMNGCGLNANFSSQKMRTPDSGFDEMNAIIEKLKARHCEHIKVYDPKCGEYNKMRMTGTHETAHVDEFTSGVGDYCTSIRIPLQVKEFCYGYIEDRRPASNANPYQVVNAILRTCFMNTGSSETCK